MGPEGEEVTYRGEKVTRGGPEGEVTITTGELKCDVAKGGRFRGLEGEVTRE